MKAVKRLSVILALAVAAVLIALFFGTLDKSDGTYSVHAASSRSGSYYYSSFHVTYDINADRTMHVNYDLAVHYYGLRGIIFDIPVNGGDRVRNLQVYRLDGLDGGTSPLQHSIHDDEDTNYSNFLSVYLDDNRVKYDEMHFYRISYDYAITKPKNANGIIINAVGFGYDTRMNDVIVKINLPDGLKADELRCWLGPESRNADDYRYFDYELSADNHTITLEYLQLPAFDGVTFDLPFENGVLSVKPDLTPYWIIIAACVILAGLFAVKFLLFNKDGLTPIPSFSVPVNPPEGNGAPDVAYDSPTSEMDPLMMGKLIDNKVDGSDITSMLYYWANKGYIKINMENKDDIILIRVYNQLPAGSPDYQVTMYNGLFKSGELVHVNSLTNKFFTTADAVTKQVNKRSSNLYDVKSMAVAIAFGLIGALLMALTPVLTAVFAINKHMFLFLPLVMVVPAVVVFALTHTVRSRRLKYKKPKMILLYAGVGALSLAISAIYLLLVPSHVIELLPNFLLGVVGFAIVMLSVTIISRSEDYNHKLNRIVGFKDFIETVEKEKLEVMLESNPEFYYNVLPYAIVLGVSDKWEKKFEGLTMQPPRWATGSSSNVILNVLVFNALMRNVNVSIARSMLSRPSSGSHSGGSFGHGGHSGGGHGGGGSRGR